MARRVNTRFLTILTVIVVTISVTALTAHLILGGESPEKFRATGQVLMAEKKYEEASKAFGRAVQLSPKSPELWVAYGDAMNELSPVDLEYMHRARQAWEQALAIDPVYKPALDRMMQWYSDVANMDASLPHIFKGLHETAQRLFEADPDNAAAEVAIHTSIIRPWLVGVEDDPKRIAATVEKLEALMKKYPENPELPMFVAQARLRDASGLRQRNQPDDAARKLAEADQIMSAALERSATAPMYFSAAQVAYGLAQLDHANADKWRARQAEHYAKARGLVTPEDPLFVYINVSAARAAAASKQRGEGEKILRELYAARPNDQEVRLALAEFLANDRAKRAEAITILEQEFAKEALRGPKAFRVRELQVRTLTVATNLRLDTLGDAADDSERKAGLEKIQKGLELIALYDGEGPRLLRLRGKLLRLQGKTIEAIQTLERAKAMAEARAGGGGGYSISRLDLLEIVDMLARAYIDTQQTASARELLVRLTGEVPEYDPARMLLAHVLIKEGKLAEASAHVQKLAERRPDDPDVIRLQLQVADGQKGGDAAQQEKNREQIRKRYAALPETTKAEAMDKVVSAMMIEQHDEAVRLINKLQGMAPGDVAVVKLAVRLHQQLNDADAARAAVETALKAKPNDPDLLVIREQVANLTPENLANIAIREADKNPDPFVRELIKATAYRRLGKSQEELKHLQAAIQIKPNDGNANALLFNHYLVNQQWPKAEAILPTLAAVNQDQAGGLLFRYRLAMAKKDIPTALNYARALVERMGEFGQSWLALAQAQQASEQFDEALKNYNNALERQSNSPEALRGAIECLYALKRPTEARRKIDDARRMLPGNAYFQEVQITHEMRWGNPEAAIAPREEQFKSNPEKPEIALALGQAYLATARARAGKPADAPKAAEMFAKARQTFKAGLTKWPDELTFYAHYAEAAARSGDLGDTEQLLKQLTQRDAWKEKPEPHLLLSEFYAIAGRPADAEATLKQVLAKHPSPETQIKLANLLAAQQKVDEAIKVLEDNGSNISIARRKIDILLASNRHEQADAVLEQALKDNPSSLQLLQLASAVHIARGKFELAEQRLNRALEINADDATTHYYVGILRMNQATPDLAKAIQHLEKARSSPMGTEARLALADCLRQRDNHDAAVRELEDALRARPDDRRVRLALIDAYTALVPPRNPDATRLIREYKTMPNYQADPEILRREAGILAAGGEVATAVERINEALAVAPDNLELTRAALDLFIKARKFPEVNQRVEQLVAKDKNLWWAYQSRAISKRQQGNKEEAVRDFEAALSAATTLGNDAAAEEVIRTMGDVIGANEVINRIQARAEKEDRWKIMIARLQQTTGDNASAVRTLEQVLARTDKLVPKDRENAYRFGGTLYLIAGQPDKAAQCYVKLLEMAPNDMTALNNLACLLAEHTQPPKPQEGLPYSQRAYDMMLKAGRRDPLVLDTHGWLLTKCQKVDEGIEILRRSLEIRATPDAHYHLGESYLAKQFAREAHGELEKALDLVKRYKQNKQPVDPTLETRIEGALARAGAMMRQKGETASSNVP